MNLLIESRKLNDALLEVEEAIDFTQKSGLGIYLFDMYSYEVWIHTLMGDIKKAGTSLQRANEIRHKVHAVPVELCAFFRSQSELYLYRLKESIKSGNRSDSLEYRKEFIKSAKMLVRISKKTAQYRTESHRLIGLYYWLLDKQKKALKFWHKAIREGERVGARLELSRAYFEVGKRLFENESRYKTLNGIKAEEYLEKARVLFEEMDLQWDLDELSRVARAQDI
jgi:tetratricopeptide (TPR) repeat protein